MSDPDSLRDRARALLDRTSEARARGGSARRWGPRTQALADARPSESHGIESLIRVTDPSHGSGSRIRVTYPDQ